VRNSDLDRGNDQAATRGIAGLVCGRWSKWSVLALWIAVVAVAGPLAGKLNGAQQNDLSAWLPNNAESTQVVELAKQFTPSDVFPALVVYERPDGAITPADQAKAAADVRAFAGVQDVTGKVLGPIPSQDGRALQVVVPFKVAEEGNGWEKLAPRVEELRSIAQADAGDLRAYVTGPAGLGAGTRAPGPDGPGTGAAHPVHRAPVHPATYRPTQERGA
jgi:RND superfamily putative drug exporter